MGKIDIAIYILLFIFLFLGFSKGFVKQVLSTANWLVSLIGAFALIKPFSSLMLKTSISSTINEKIATWIAAKGAIFTVPFDPTNSSTQLSNAITELGLPKFIANAIASGVNITPTGEAITLADVLAPSIGNILVTIISFIILFFAILIVIKIIISLLNVVFDKGILGFVNKILGAALGLVKAVLIICIAMLIVSALTGVVPALNDFLVKDLRLGTDTFSIGKYFYENNPLVKLFENSFSFDNILG